MITQSGTFGGEALTTALVFILRYLITKISASGVPGTFNHSMGRIVEYGWYLDKVSGNLTSGFVNRNKVKWP